MLNTRKQATEHIWLRKTLLFTKVLHSEKASSILFFPQILSSGCAPKVYCSDPSKKHDRQGPVKGPVVLESTLGVTSA